MVKKRGCLGCGFLGSLTLCAVCGIVFWFVYGKPASGLQSQIEAARKEGVPVEIEDIQSAPPADPTLNAATVYRDLVAMFDDPKAKSAMQVALGEKSTIAEVERALVTLKPVIDLVEEAARRPVLAPDRDWTDPFNVVMPELAASKSAAKLLIEKAKTQARNGNGVEAMKTLSRAYTFARHSSQTPMLIGYLVAVAEEALILRGMEAVLNSSGQDPKTVAEGRKTLASFGPVLNLRDAMGGEVITSRTVLHMKSNPPDWFGATNDPLSQSSVIMTRFGPVRNAFDARAIEEFRRLYRDMPTDREDYLGFEQATRAMDERMASERSPTAMMLKMTTPVFGQAGATVRQTVARRRLMNLALDLCDHYNARKSLQNVIQPKSEITVDPYSGEPFLIRSEPRGFIVWSVGRNKIDDGGSRSYELDITVRVKH